MHLDIEALKLQGTYAIQLHPARDERGYFLRAYDETTFLEHGLTTAWVQENHAFSNKSGIVRGLHFQRPPHAETKLVRVARGAVFDVFVDLRANSPTYGRWDSIDLTAENMKCVYIPKGFAHGYCTLSDDSLVLYKVDSCYAPDAEGGIRWNDSGLAIPWPVESPVLSAKDSQWPSFREFLTPFA
jgi:dTDP-4-dehydrorhamnose 3,5-epimerase